MNVPTAIFTASGPCQVCQVEEPCYLDTEALISYCLSCLESAVDHAAQEQALLYPGDNYEWEAYTPITLQLSEEEEDKQWIQAEEVRNFCDFAPD